uniref:Uncharacterized protein n=1 Tax=Photinus pyralis TaxID=7054 RepID=A0A1Y1KTN2_PHOPY
MERAITTGRTWQSLMKEHFRKVVIHDLAHSKFKLTAKEVKVIQYGYHSSAGDSSSPRKRDDSSAADSIAALASVTTPIFSRRRHHQRGCENPPPPPPVLLTMMTTDTDKMWINVYYMF